MFTAKPAAYIPRVETLSSLVKLSDASLCRNTPPLVKAPYKSVKFAKYFLNPTPRSVIGSPESDEKHSYL